MPKKRKKPRKPVLRRAPLETRDPIHVATSKVVEPAPGGNVTFVRNFVLGGVAITDCYLAGNVRDIEIVAGPGTLASPTDLPDAAINLGTHLPGLYMDVWSNRPHMIAGGSIGRLAGRLDHDPGAPAPAPPRRGEP